MYKLHFFNVYVISLWDLCRDVVLLPFCHVVIFSLAQNIYMFNLTMKNGLCKCVKFSLQTPKFSFSLNKNLAFFKILILSFFLILGFLFPSFVAKWFIITHFSFSSLFSHVQLVFFLSHSFFFIYNGKEKTWIYNVRFL